MSISTLLDLFLELWPSFSKSEFLDPVPLLMNPDSNFYEPKLSSRFESFDSSCIELFLPGKILFLIFGIYEYLNSD